MESNIDNRSENDEQNNKLKKYKDPSKKGEQEEFNKILDLSLRRLRDAIRYKNRDIFELLDPLISDTQCHMHALLLLNILHKCYDKKNFTYCGIDKLHEDEKLILSYGVLFTLLRIECKDEFGFVVYETSLRDFDRRLFPSRKREKYYIRKAKEEFNYRSVDYIKSVARKEIKEILNSCEASSVVVSLKLLPRYASTLAIIDHMQRRKWPIIISLMIIEIEMMGDSIGYKINGNDVRFYDYREDANKFVYKNELNESEKKVPSLTFCCYSIIRSRDHSLEFPSNYDLRDLLMMCAASQRQIPKNSKLPDGYNDAEDYAEDLYRKYDGVYKEYAKYREIAMRKNLVDARYSTVLRSSGKEVDDEVSVTVKRRGEDASFSVDHVYVSNYSREFQKLKSIDFNNKIDQIQIFKLNNKANNFQVSNRDLY